MLSSSLDCLAVAPQGSEAEDKLVSMPYSLHVVGSNPTAGANLTALNLPAWACPTAMGQLPPRPVIVHPRCVGSQQPG
jgi:hypothetical protein